MSKIALVFAGIVLAVLLLFFNVDFSSKSSDIVLNTKEKTVIKHKKKDVKIVFEDTKKSNSKKVEKTVFKESKPVETKGMFVLSKASVGGYGVSLNTLRKPKVSKFAPPSFPTFVKGEINGEKFSLSLPSSAKKEDIFLTITTKSGQSIKVNADALKNTKAGALIDVGNLTPPQEVKEDQVKTVAKDIEQKVEDSVEESKNTQDESQNSIAPPMPPAIR